MVGMANPHANDPELGEIREGGKTVEGPPRKSLEEDLLKVKRVGDPLDEHFRDIAQDLDRLQLDKGEFYRDSWRKRGSLGAYMNLARKIDRLENMVGKCAVGFELDINKVGGEDFVDTLADLSVYAVKLLTLIRHNYPDVYEQWVNRVVNK